MQVLNLTPVARQGGGSVKIVATFDIELSNEVRLYGLRLLEATDGKRFAYAAQAGNRRSATFSRSLSEAITAAASFELEAATANDLSQSAA
ncbi:hypothetical protein [Rhizobium mongolense]|uniref:Endo-beta-N-acetylglucosaminidase D n=1 Tax=Rhizobium mongolense TaxID=57676 RepID=A0A7W6RHX5_9HYPH|nr:hypothetical protein [Rhizobium mongolense]MBB4272772.1 endo-beta-N-acetylglucosaminidase D [Rhizobium mongolense]